MLALSTMPQVVGGAAVAVVHDVLILNAQENHYLDKGFGGGVFVEFCFLLLKSQMLFCTRKR